MTWTKGIEEEDKRQSEAKEAASRERQDRATREATGRSSKERLAGESRERSRSRGEGREEQKEDEHAKTDIAQAEEGGKTRKKKTAGGKSGKKTQSSMFAFGPQPGTNKGPAKGPLGLDMWDLGGSGDCGFRVVALAIASYRGKEKAKAEEKVPAGVGALRGRMLEALKKDTSWKAHWFKDPKTEERMEGGPVPTRAEEHEKALGRPNRWVCPQVLQLLAETNTFDLLTNATCHINRLCLKVISEVKVYRGD